MWSIDRLRRENLAIQNALRNQLVSGGTSYFPSAAPELAQSGAGNILSSSAVETLLTLHSQNALQQHIQNQQLASIQASLLSLQSGLTSTASTDSRNDITAALCHPLSKASNGMKMNTTLPTDSQLIQLTDVINCRFAQEPQLGQAASRLDLLSSIVSPGATQPALAAMKNRANPLEDSARVMEKERAASFAPVRKKSKDVGSKPSSNSQETKIIKEMQMEKKPSKNFTKWHTMLEALKNFKNSHGHCIVPRGFEDMKLASWVVEQRKQYRRYQENLSCGIDQDRIDRLNEIGFTWDAQEAAWDRQMDHLREFHRIHGHCDVPRDNVQFPRLYLWIREQRRHYKLMKKGQSTLLTNSRIDALNRVGFSFDSLGAIFKSRVQELSEFRRVHGHCRVPLDYAQNSKLFGWIERMKKEYRLKMNGQKSTLSEAHISALNELEFPWFSGKTEGSERFASNSADDSSLSSNYDDDDAASTLSSSLEVASSSSFEFEKGSARPLKKRRIV